MQAEPLFHWSESASQFVEFVAVFLATGAVGFRYSSLVGRLGGRAPAGAVGLVYRNAAGRAAVIGLIGELILLARTAFLLPQMAARAHGTVGQMLTHYGPASVGFWLGVLALIGFALALARVAGGWPLAGLAIVVGAFLPLFTGHWEQAVNPLHRFFGGLWLGTLFSLVVAGMVPVLRDEPVRAERGAIVAAMVNAFSPVALVSGLLLVLTGIINAWRHLGSWAAFWTTDYGIALLVKLALVVLVFALGAWNWRRQRPRLGGEGAAMSVRRSARAELAMATLVLIATAVLVTFPAPAEEHHHPPRPNPAAPLAAPAAQPDAD